MDAEQVLDGLNPEQRRAAEAVRGPVCILAGAGSGKTTTITRRVAYQVGTGAFAAEQLLAVTFTDKAAGEMRSRLEALGVRGVRASTFHSAALAQLRWFAAEPPPKILASKALPLRRIGNTLPMPFRFRPAGDLATEVEWAKNRRVRPDAYLRSLDGHEPPIPPDLMVRVYREYECRKSEAGYADFEDLLELAIRMYDDEPFLLEELRSRYLAFTVDEYQDVNLLQQTLLERWLGERDELCAVGDDYQSIYAFTGASPEWLLGMTEQFPQATVVRLERNYRSTPQVLELANRLVPKLGGAEKVLRSTLPLGPEPIVRRLAGPEEQATFVCDQVEQLRGEGVPYEEMAVLARTNARLADFEEAFGGREIPFQGSALLARDGARQLLKRLRYSDTRSVAKEVLRIARDQGLLERPPERLGERELTRQNDLARLVRLAEEFDDGTRDVAEFTAWLRERFGAGADRQGVHLLTYHGAKGLEFEAVFLPRLEEREFPSRLAKTDEALAEERRLLYVGMTRAKRHLVVTWGVRPSRFLAELGIETTPPRRERPRDEDLPPAFGALREWRLERAKADGIPAYVVFHDSTLAEIAARGPETLHELAAVAGVGPAKLDRYGSEVLTALRLSRSALAG